MILCYHSLVGQGIYGHVFYSDSTPCTNCIINLFNIDTSSILGNTITDAKGTYKLEPKSTYPSRVILSCRSLNIYENYITIDLTQYPDSSLRVDFEVTFKIIELKEVTITTVIPNINDDTVRYQIEKYRTFDDKKLSDILNKLPGVEYNENTGEIKYKGKSIETVMIDGDDVLGSDYKNVIRTIPLDILQSIEGISDYHKNPLYKKVTKSEEVVLNLTLKDGATAFNGELSFGLGFDHHHAQFTPIFIKKKIKALAEISKNNFGINNSPFIDGFNSFEFRNDQPWFSVNPLENSELLRVFYWERGYQNKLLFGSANTLFKLSPSLSIRSYITKSKDMQKSNQKFDQTYNTGRNQFDFHQSNSTTFIPVYYKMSHEIEWNHHNKTRVLMVGRWLTNQFETINKTIFNNTSFKEIVGTEKKNYYSFLANLTHKLSDSSVIETASRISSDKIFTTVIFDTTTEVRYDSIIYNNQQIQTNRQLFLQNLKWTKNWGTLTTIGGISYTRNKAPSFTRQINSFEYSEFLNNTFAIVISATYPGRKYFISSSLGMINHNQSIRVPKSIDKTQRRSTFINPSMNVKWLLHQDQFLTLGFQSYRNTTFRQYYSALPYLYDLYTLNTSNAPLIVPLENRFQGTYNYIDLQAQRSLTVNILYRRLKENPIIDKKLNERYIFLTTNNSSLLNHNYYSSLTVSTLWYKMKHVASFTAIGDWTRYYTSISSVNQLSTLNQIQFITSLKSAFSDFFNYKYSIGFSQQKSKIIRSKQEFSNRIIQSTLELNSRIQNHSLKVSQDWIMILGHQLLSKPQIFIDINYEARISSNLDIGISGKNLLNIESYIFQTTNEVSKTIMTRGLFPRAFLFGLNYRF